MAVWTDQTAQNIGQLRRICQIMTYLKTKTKTNMQHIKHNLNFIMAQSIIFYYQVLNCIILFIVVAVCLFVLFCKKLCKTEVSYSYRKKYKKRKIQNVCTKNNSAANSIFWYPLFFFLFGVEWNKKYSIEIE